MDTRQCINTHTHAHRVKLFSYTALLTELQAPTHKLLLTPTASPKVCCCNC